MFFFNHLRRQLGTRIHKRLGPVKVEESKMLFQNLRLHGLGGDTSLLPGKIQNERAASIECVSNSKSAKDLKLCPLLPPGDLNGSLVAPLQ